MDKQEKKNIKQQANVLRGYLRKKQEKLTDGDRQNIKDAAQNLKAAANSILDNNEEDSAN